MPEDYSQISDSDLIALMTKFWEHREKYASYLSEWERRKRIQEDQMLSMTKTLVDETKALVDETDKLLNLSRRM